MIKENDLVICKDVSGFDMSHLKEGKMYEVELVSGADIRLKGVEYSTKVWRFEKMGEEKK